MIACDAVAEYGYIHSLETCGTVDGPGLRYVIFFQGCSLRCLYCHNPDSWLLRAGKKMHITEIIQDVKKYLPYLKHGGVTLSGGEPLLQAEFAATLLRELKQLGLHTAIDTAGAVALAKAEPVLQFTDLVLLDIKAINPVLFKTITGAELAPTLALAQYLNQINKSMWLRLVLVPGLTDQPEHLQQLAQYCTTLTNIARIEILPFHQLGEYKWQELGYHYQLQATPEPTVAQIQNAYKIFRQYGLPVA